VIDDYQFAIATLDLDPAVTAELKLISQAVRLAWDLAPKELPQQLLGRIVMFPGVPAGPITYLIASCSSWPQSDLRAQLGLDPISFFVLKQFPAGFALPGGSLVTTIDVGEDEPYVPFYAIA
jgi:hypothetical protein